MDALEALLRVAVAAAALLGMGCVIAVVLWRRERRRGFQLQAALHELDARKRGQSVRYGQITEQFAPFMADWPWDPKRFKFIGDPIDGIQFTEQGVVFVEIKSASSRLSPVQAHVKELVQAGRVHWYEHRIG